jgi:hypothetical protein
VRHRLDSRTAVDKRIEKLGERLAEGRDDAHARDDNPLH